MEAPTQSDHHLMNQRSFINPISRSIEEWEYLEIWLENLHYLKHLLHEQVCEFRR